MRLRACVRVDLSLCRYSIDRNTDLERFFNVDAHSGVISTAKPLDREANSVHNLTIFAIEIRELQRRQSKTWTLRSEFKAILLEMIIPFNPVIPHVSVEPLSDPMRLQTGAPGASSPFHFAGAADAKHSPVVPLSERFTSHSVQLFDPPPHPPHGGNETLSEGRPSHPGTPPLKLDVKKWRLPFVQPPTVQKTIFFHTPPPPGPPSPQCVCLLSQFPPRRRRSANTMDGSHHRTIC